MIREILSLLKGGGLGLSEMAEMLGISTGDLKGRLELLERMGYIKAMTVGANKPSAACALCPSANLCASDNASACRLYGLADKGRRVWSL